MSAQLLNTPPEKLTAWQLAFLRTHPAEADIYAARWRWNPV